MDEPPGAKLSSKGSAIYGMAVKRLRGLTMNTLDKEPRWRTRGRELKTGFTKTW
jgi:hydrogenase small subunit